MSAQASRLIVLLVSAAFLWPVQALGQDYDLSRRGMAGLNLQVGLPQGEFDRFVDAAGARSNCSGRRSIRCAAAAST